MAFRIYKAQQRPKGPEGISNLLQANKLAHVVNKAQQLATVEKILQTALPEHLTTRCHAMSINDGVLSIMVDSAAFITQLRFSENDLLYAIQEHGRMRHVQRLNFRVRLTDSPAKAATAMPGNTLSSTSKQLIQRAADNVNDSELKSALLKLSS